MGTQKSSYLKNNLDVLKSYNYKGKKVSFSP